MVGRRRRSVRSTSGPSRSRSVPASRTSSRRRLARAACSRSTRPGTDVYVESNLPRERDARRSRPSLPVTGLPMPRRVDRPPNRCRRRRARHARAGSRRGRGSPSTSRRARRTGSRSRASSWCRPRGVTGVTLYPAGRRGRRRRRRDPHCTSSRRRRSRRRSRSSPRCRGRGSGRHVGRPSARRSSGSTTGCTARSIATGIRARAAGADRRRARA